MIQLVSVVGGGRVDDSDHTALLTVIQNDDPIYIAETHMVGSEGQTKTFTISRGGRKYGKRERGRKLKRANFICLIFLTF